MSQLLSFISTIEEMYEKDFSPEGKLTLEKRLLPFTDKVFQLAIKNIEADRLTWRPKWPEVVSYCERAAYELKPKESTKHENIGGSTSKLQFEMGKKLRELIFSGKVSRQDLLDNIRRADGVMPHTGWDKCGMTLEKHHKDSNFDLSKPPSNDISFEIN